MSNRRPNYRLGAKEARKYSAQNNERGINRPRMPYPLSKSSFGESDYGYQVKGMQCPNPNYGPDAHYVTAIKIHVETLMELEAMPAPKLKGI